MDVRATNGVKSLRRGTTEAIECHLCGLDDHDVSCRERLGETEQKQKGRERGGREEEMRGGGAVTEISREAAQIKFGPGDD